MPTERARRINQRIVLIARVLIDYVAAVLGFWYGYVVQIPLAHAGLISPGIVDNRPEFYSGLSIVFGLLCLGAFWKMNLYRESASILNLRELQTAIKGSMLAGSLFLALLLLMEVSRYSRLVLVLGICMSAVFVLLERRFVAGMMRGLLFGGRIGRRNILVYGSGKTGVLLMKKLVQAPHKASRIVGFIDDFAPIDSSIRCRIDQSTPFVFEARVLGRLTDLKQLVTEHDVDELLVTVSLTNAERHQELIELAREADVQVGVVPRFGELRADQLEFEDLSAVPVLRPSSNKKRRVYPAVKRLSDIVIATILLIITAPIWVLVAVAIRSESEGPIFFKQTRIGRGEVPFQMYKFRTMYRDTQPYAPSPVRDMDTRITRAGRILRMGGLDELPQVLNVLRGEMSMVGPRPEMPFIVEKYTAFEKQRLSVKPGITGVWQLSCDRHAEIHENLEYDLYYIRHQSFLLDVLLLFETVFFTIDMIGARILRKGEPESRQAGIRRFEGARLNPEAEEQGYVVVALDQRKSETIPESWTACGPVLSPGVCGLPVKAVVAPDNIVLFDQLADEHRTSWDTNGRPGLEYIPYKDRSELRAVTLEARLVITDLPHVIQWARQAGVDALVVRDGSLLWVKRQSEVDDVIRDLAEHVNIRQHSADTLHDDGKRGFERVFG